MSQSSPMRLSGFIWGLMGEVHSPSLVLNFRFFGRKAFFSYGPPAYGLSSQGYPKWFRRLLPSDLMNFLVVAVL